MPFSIRPKKILLAALSVPISFLLLHLILRAFNLFAPASLLVRSEHEGKTYVSTNPDYLKQFFQRAQVPSPAPLWIELEKKPGVRRVILLGESAAAGFPVTDYNLARLVEAGWNHRHPAEPVEVINLAASAINSHVIRLMAREAMQLKPDLVILYAGHNEVIGPFGPASKFGQYSTSLPMIRARIALRNSRIGQSLSALAGLISRGQESGSSEWSGLNEFKDSAFPYADPRLEPMYRHVDLNFRDIVAVARESGAACLVAIPSVNLNDWEPVASEGESADLDQVIADQRTGELAKHRSADLVYRAGKRMQEAEGINMAWALFRRACDLDTKRLRADGRIKDMLRALAGDHGTPVTVVDCDRWIHELNPGFFSDREFFLEHVHLTFEGRAAVALRIVDGMESIWSGKMLDESPEAAARWWNDFRAAATELRKRTLFTEYDDHDMWSLAWKLLRLEVFRGASGLEERRNEMASRVTYLQNRARLDWGPGQVKAAYERAAVLHADDPLVHFTAGRLLMLTGQSDLAEAAFRRGFALQPNHSAAWLNYAMLSLKRGNPDGAREALAALEKFDPSASGIEELKAALGITGTHTKRL